MTVRLNLANGELKYQLFNLAQATQEGEALEYTQFINKLRDGTGEPDDETLGSDGEFYVDTDAAILYFKIGGTWTSIGGGSGGGTALTVSDSDTSVSDTSEIDFTGSYWDVTPDGTTDTKANVSINEAIATDTGVTGVSGLISAADKTKLDLSLIHI